MPLKSKATAARQERITKYDAPVTPSISQDEQTNRNISAVVAGMPTAKKQRASRTPNPNVAARKQATERMKAILKEAKIVKSNKVSALRQVEQQFESKLRDLQTEYNSLNNQHAKTIFS